MITINGFDAKFWTFPGGERSVKLTPDHNTRGLPMQIRMDFKGSDDLIDLVLTVNALRNMYGSTLELTLLVPYLPFSRQDRVMTSGESFGLQAFASIVNMCNFSRVTTWDVHSDVAAALFPAGVFKNISQEDLWGSELRVSAPSAIISPDAGALKKIYKVAEKAGIKNVIEATKVRDVATGQIVATRIDSSRLVNLDTAVIVDDICDGGRTFIELAKVIRDAGFTGRLILCVTHGIFSKGLDAFGGVSGFNEIYTMNNINNVDLDSFNK